MLYVAEFSSSLIANSSATASFRQFVSGTISALETVGLVNTYASGTINSGTIDPPTAANQFRGYVVMRFNDTLQSTSPVFIRIEFGSSTTAANTPAYAFTLGSYHDGSGTLSNASTRRTAGTSFNSANPPVGINLFSGDMSTNARLAFSLAAYGSDGLGRPCGLVVHRTRNQSGQDTNVGIHFMTLSSQGAAAQGYLTTNLALSPYTLERASSPSVYVANESVASTGRTNFSQSVSLVNALNADICMEDVGAVPVVLSNVPTFINVQFGSTQRKFFILPTGPGSDQTSVNLRYIIRAD